MKILLRAGFVAFQFVGLAGVAVMWTAMVIGGRIEDSLIRAKEERVARLRRELEEAQRESA